MRETETIPEKNRKKPHPLWIQSVNIICGAFRTFSRQQKQMDDKKLPVENFNTEKGAGRTCTLGIIIFSFPAAEK